MRLGRQFWEVQVVMSSRQSEQRMKRPIRRTWTSRESMVQGAQVGFSDVAPDSKVQCTAHGWCVVCIFGTNNVFANSRAIRLPVNSSNGELVTDGELITVISSHIVELTRWTRHTVFNTQYHYDVATVVLSFSISGHKCQQHKWRFEFCQLQRFKGQTSSSVVALSASHCHTNVS